MAASHIEKKEVAKGIIVQYIEPEGLTRSAQNEWGLLKKFPSPRTKQHKTRKLSPDDLEIWQIRRSHTTEVPLLCSFDFIYHVDGQMSGKKHRGSKFLWYHGLC